MEGTGFSSFLLTALDSSLSEIMVEGSMAIAAALAATGTAILLFDGERLRVRVVAGLSQRRQMKRVDIAPGQGIIGLCFANGAPFVSGDLAADPRVLNFEIASKAGIRSCAVVPLRLCGSVLGVLAVGDRARRVYRPGEVALLQACADGLSLALHHAVVSPGVARDWAKVFSGIKPARSMSIAGGMGKPEANPPELPTCQADEFPKGVTGPTLDLILGCIRGRRRSVSRKELSRLTGLSGVTLAHYLGYLEELGLVTKRQIYGKPGRPQFIYQSAESSRRRSKEVRREGLTPSESDLS